MAISGRRLYRAQASAVVQCGDPRKALVQYRRPRPEHSRRRPVCVDPKKLKAGREPWRVIYGADAAKDVCDRLLLPIADALIHLAHQIRLGVHVGDKGYAHEAWLIFDGW